ncbi:tRNA lysidine(34) synthetase TilS [Lacimicrobium alkaliphilum]|nr:tRNA lysidine(34) synthetase TilS [Lacimicrobium alkaliphilum]
MLYLEFEHCLLTYLTASQPIYVAYSGGMDSHVALHLLARFAARHPEHQAGAVHIHHGLSANADNWLEHCAGVCKTMGIHFVSRRLSISKSKGESLEARARTARYQAIGESIPQGAMVLLGQHQQDQVETLLLQLKRGAGPKGLSAMAEHSRYDGLDYCRPLLQCSLQQLREYASVHRLSWIEDESNQDLTFDRNFLRHQIIPLLEQRWPGVQKTVARSARLCAEQQQLLDLQSQANLELVRGEAGTLSLPALAGFSCQWRKQIIRFWLAEQGAEMPAQTILRRLEEELIAASQDASPCITWGDWQLRRFDQALYLLRGKPAEAPRPVNWNGEAQVILSDDRRLCFHQGPVPPGRGQWTGLRVEPPVSIEFSGWSERFRPAGAKVSKPLKHWMRLWKIPPWQRAQVPLLRHHGILVAALGYGGADEYQPGSGDKHTVWVAMA